MLQASKQWQWIACAEKNRLLLDLNDDMQLCTPYKLDSSPIVLLKTHTSALKMQPFMSKFIITLRSLIYGTLPSYAK